jgi:uncharacterized protein (TIGR02001 family)
VPSSRETPIRTACIDPVLACVFALVLDGIAQAGVAHAQVSGTLTVVSDYRFRGVSLSADEPAAQGGLVYDDPSRWYAGAFVSTVKLAGESATSAQAALYTGATLPLGDAAHWDVGAYYSAFSDNRAYDYGEAYVGIAFPEITLRIHYSPDYFGTARGSFYGEINASRALGAGFVAFGHVGVLVPEGRAEDTYTATVQNPVDARAGIGFETGAWKLRVAWVGINGIGTNYPVAGAQRRRTAVASVSWSF